MRLIETFERGAAPLRTSIPTVFDTSMIHMPVNSRKATLPQCWSLTGVQLRAYATPQPSILIDFNQNDRIRARHGRCCRHCRGIDRLGIGSLWYDQRRQIPIGHETRGPRFRAIEFLQCFLIAGV